jgi:nitroimidazol reductase NimA-like FMN-containing flavoprotein (pyridoxamine 5'-phosphate oxidase superfamily)
VGVLPVIIPVNYLLDEDTVVFRTDAGSKLHAAIRGAPVAFEVDGVDQDRQVGWSVVVRGRAEEVTDPVKLAELRQSPLGGVAPQRKRALRTGQTELGDRQAHHDCRRPSQLVGIIRSLITDRQPKLTLPPPRQRRRTR